ncbi:MAG TPA: beta-propeller domain-containing protein [Pyrinomonadaceae bacterium]|nr:beta-propeller domain-containing protein [Pyrinomonadaceae bacterium]
MRKSIFAAGVVLTAGIAVFSYNQLRTDGEPISPQVSIAKPGKTMPAFSSEEELKAQMKKKRQQRERDMNKSAGAANQGVTTDSVAASPASPSAKAESKPSDSKSKDDDGITNNQVAGVDEGGIVKTHGDHLVILRRGRLFTVKVGDNALKPVSAVNAYPPDINPSNDWYDEMLISGNTVVVVGYSYGRGGTELNLFNIDEVGGLKYKATYHLKSNDYYSSRNYASRLIGSKLVFYTPQYIGYSDDPMSQFPKYRKWHNGAKEDEFKPVVSATRVYRPNISEDRSSMQALHTVTTCDLATAEFSCQGTAILGSAGRIFYVSQTSVYVWTTDYNYRNGKSDSESMLYKMPLDGSAPQALGVAGAPIDQFSFNESDDEQLNVLVRGDGRGEAMWNSEYAIGDTSLFRVSADTFSDGSTNASVDNYRSLPKSEGYTFQNRFVGDYVLYGSGNGWGNQTNKNSTPFYAVNWKTANVHYLNLQHSVDRIEQLGKAAVVVGINGNDLYFTPIKLGKRPDVKDSYVRPNASQGELRSHGFFYKPDDDNSGILGLPIARSGRAGYRHLDEDSAAILFLKNSGLDFDQIGELEAKNTSTNDGCRASCVDWYGNARPIFLRGRIFALLGYELVEGRLDDGRLFESRRINYSPRIAMSQRTEDE